MEIFTAGLVLDARNQLGAGALWHGRTGRLCWVDVAAHKVHACEPATARTHTALVGQPVGAVVPTRRGEVLVALQRQFAFLDFRGGRITPFPVQPLEPVYSCFNLGRCDPAGRCWAGSAAVDGVGEVGRLHCLFPDLHVEPRLAGLTRPAGLAWSRDGRTLYLSDSVSGAVDAFDFDAVSASVAQRRTLRRFEPGTGTPAGITVDTAGQLWVALWDGGRVERIDATSGATLAIVRLPVQRATSCAFGGPDRDTLYITTARLGLTDQQLQAQPAAGGVFAAKTGVSGPDEVEFSG